MKKRLPEILCMAAVLVGLLALAALFAPVFLQSIAYTLVFAAAGVIAGATGQKPCAQLCRLYFEGARLCGSVLVLYFFMIFWLNTQRFHLIHLLKRLSPSFSVNA